MSELAARGLSGGDILIVCLKAKRVVLVESSCACCRRGLPGLAEADHKFVRICGWFALPVFLVDNVATTVATIVATCRALGFGRGLVFANAALSAKAVVKPTKEFHTARHRNNFELGMLNFECNQLSAFLFQLFLPVVPVAASVETKLGGGVSFPYSTPPQRLQ